MTTSFPSLSLFARFFIFLSFSLFARFFIFLSFSLFARFFIRILRLLLVGCQDFHLGRLMLVGGAAL